MNAPTTGELPADEQFRACLQALRESSAVDQDSLGRKLEQIRENAKSPDTAADIATEIRAAAQFISLPSVSRLEFGEHPDLMVRLSTEEMAIEVKKFRWRDEDANDERRFREARGTGVLPEYGNPKEVQAQLIEAIRKKASKNDGTRGMFFVYLWSESAHNVEDAEIQAAINVLRSEPIDRLAGIFFTWNPTCVQGFAPLIPEAGTPALAKMLAPRFVAYE
ncbi:MAG: hypothetical protein HYY13_01650 [Nitrospirae bacterium]|nr:hypothetical protein [Nitrospirota bacterium]